MGTSVKSVYVETSIVSYLAGKASHDLLTAACQQATRDWWHDHRDRYELFSSQMVIAEASAGDTESAEKRLVYLEEYLLSEIMGVLFVVQHPVEVVDETALIAADQIREEIRLALEDRRDQLFVGGLHHSSRHGLVTCGVREGCRAASA